MMIHPWQVVLVFGLWFWIPWLPCRFKWFWFLATGTFGGLADMSYNYNAAVSCSVPYLSTVTQLWVFLSSSLTGYALNNDGERCSLQNCLSSMSLFIFLTPPPDFRIWLVVNSL